MAPEIRIAAPEEALAAVAPIWHYFGSFPSEERAERVLGVMPEGRLLAAFDGGSAVGGAGSFAFDLTVPGGPVPVAGVSVVGVLPTHRRRGILRELMAAQLRDLHERGEALAVLWASEGGIYGRFGYGLASLAGEMDLLRVHAGFARPPERDGDVRLAKPSEELPRLREVYDAVAAATPGMIGRTQAWWETRIVHDPDWRRGDAGELNAAVIEADGRAVAYALYRLALTFGEGGSKGRTEVVEAMGVSPQATADIWRFLLEVDWMERVHAHLLPVDHPLIHLLMEPARMRFRVGDGLWVRLVDVAAALASRSLAGDGSVVVEVRDAFCPWNEGRYRVEPGAAERTDAEPDLRLDVDALGSVHLGGFGFAELARAGRVEEASPGAIARADALFATDRAPWCPEIF